jgi:hypothetical protein
VAPQQSDGVHRTVAVSVFRYESHHPRGFAVGVAAPPENKKVTFRDVSQDSDGHVVSNSASTESVGGGSGDGRLGSHTEQRRSSKDNSNSGGGIVRRYSDSNGVVTRQYSELISAPPAVVGQVTQWILRLYYILVVFLVIQSYCIAYFDSLPNKVKLNRTP